MQTTLAATALLMGLAGGPHCVAMCGSACAGIGRASGALGARALWTFQLGRLLGYSTMGAIAAMSMQSLGWLSVYSAALRPAWTMLHVAAAVLGLMLLFQARQPLWLENSAKKIWSNLRNVTKGMQTGAPLILGLLWSLLPCGLLYSALLVAALTSSITDGAFVMALFALGSSVSLMAGPWLWLRLRSPHSGRWAMRIAGLALFSTSAWGLWMGLVHNTAPWCVTA